MYVQLLGADCEVLEREFSCCFPCEMVDFK